MNKREEDSIAAKKSKGDSRHSPQQVMDHCSLFQGMSAAEREQLEVFFEHETYPRDEVVIREGKSIQILWIIAEGRCEVFKSRKDGSEQQLAVLGAGSVFGEMSFFKPAPHTASIRTLSDVEVLRLPREKFGRLEETGSSAAYKLAVNTAKVLIERLTQMDDWICDLVEKPDAANSHREEWKEFRTRLYSEWQD